MVAVSLEIKIFFQCQSSRRKSQDDATPHMKACRVCRVTFVSGAAVYARIMLDASESFLLVVTLVITAASRKNHIRSTALYYERFLVPAFLAEEHRKAFSVAGFSAWVAFVAVAAWTSNLVDRIFFPFFPISFLLHLCCMQFFFFRQALAGNFFQNHPPPPPPPQELNGRPLRVRLRNRSSQHGHFQKRQEKKVTGFYDVVIKIFGYVSARFVMLSTLTISN